MLYRIIQAISGSEKIKSVSFLRKKNQQENLEENKHNDSINFKTQNFNCMETQNT